MSLSFLPSFLKASTFIGSLNSSGIEFKLAISCIMLNLAFPFEVLGFFLEAKYKSALFFNALDILYNFFALSSVTGLSICSV